MAEFGSLRTCVLDFNLPRLGERKLIHMNTQWDIVRKSDGSFAVENGEFSSVAPDCQGLKHLLEANGFSDDQRSEVDKQLAESGRARINIPPSNTCIRQISYEAAMLLDAPVINYPG